MKRTTKTIKQSKTTPKKTVKKTTVHVEKKLSPVEKLDKFFDKRHMQRMENRASKMEKLKVQSDLKKFKSNRSEGTKKFAEVRKGVTEVAGIAALDSQGERSAQTDMQKWIQSMNSELSQGSKQQGSTTSIESSAGLSGSGLGG